MRKIIKEPVEIKIKLRYNKLVIIFNLKSRKLEAAGRKNDRYSKLSSANESPLKWRLSSFGHCSKNLY